AQPFQRARRAADAAVPFERNARLEPAWFLLTALGGFEAGEIGNVHLAHALWQRGRLGEGLVTAGNAQIVAGRCDRRSAGSRLPGDRGQGRAERDRACGLLVDADGHGYGAVERLGGAGGCETKRLAARGDLLRDSPGELRVDRCGREGGELCGRGGGG